MELKKCNKCGEAKPLEGFYKNKRVAIGKTERNTMKKIESCSSRDQ